MKVISGDELSYIVLIEPCGCRHWKTKDGISIQFCKEHQINVLDSLESDKEP